MLSRNALFQGIPVFLDSRKAIRIHIMFLLLQLQVVRKLINYHVLCRENISRFIFYEDPGINSLNFNMHLNLVKQL